MKTSKQDRIQEYTYLAWQSANGKLLHRSDVLRYIELHEEFGKPRSNDSKTSESV